MISDALMRDIDCEIGGVRRASSSGARFDVIDPATEEVITTVADGTPSDVVDAVAAAAESQPGWASRAPRARSEILRRCFALILEHAEELAELIVRENGKPIAEARSEVTYSAEFFRWFAEEAVRAPGSIGTAPTGGSRMIVMHEPVGVALLVTPWNLPAAMAARKIAPALAAGCAVVLKPATETPLTALALAALLREAGVPPGVVNVVPTTNNAGIVSAALSDARVRKLSFTGSTDVGRLLLAQAAKRVVNCSMELGGNAPFIVFKDADLDTAIDGAMIAKMRHNGEACTAANRFFVEAAIAEAFSERLATAMGALKVGCGLDPDVRVGPLIDERALEKVTMLVDGAKASGAAVLTGGSRASGRGYFYPPTVLGGVRADAEILRHEVFGPVAPMVTFTDADDMVAMANDTEHGLVSYVYTQDLAKGMRIAEALESGMVGLNKGVVSDPAAPFGGVKQSGIGREGGDVGMLEFMETKYIATSW